MVSEKSRFDLFSEKLRDWTLAICAFFAMAFYYDSRDNDEKQADILQEISKNTAVSAEIDKRFAKRLDGIDKKFTKEIDSNNKRDDEQDKELKKLGKGLVALETKFEYSGSR